MYQQVTLIGRLGRDPEMRYTSSGTAVTSFSIAVSKTWTANGERKEQTTWFRIQAWNKLAEVCNNFLAKGKLVFVTGELKTPQVYKSKDGEYRTSLDVIAREVKFLSPKDEQSDTSDNDERFGDTEEIPF